MKKLIITMVAIAFCGSTFAEDYSGSLEIRKIECSSYRCDYTYTLTNTSSTYINPTLELLILDCSYNTIEEDTIFFDRIFSGKRQVKRTSHLKSDDGPIIKVLTYNKSLIG